MINTAPFQARRTEPIYRSILPIGNPQTDPAEVVDDVYDCMLAWIDKKSLDFTQRPFKTLAGAWLDEASFQVSEADFNCTIVQDHPDNYRYAFRVETGDHEDARRRWIVNACVFIENGRAYLDLQTFCSVPSAMDRLPRSVPSFLRDVLEKHPIIDVIGLTMDPWEIATGAACASLVSLLSDPARRLPVVVASEPYLLNMDYLARRLLGVAHVVKISHEAGFMLSDTLSKQWSVYFGAVRTYRTPFLPEHDDVRAHPLALSIGILNFKDGSLVGPTAFTPIFIDRVYRGAISGAAAYPRHDMLTLRREIMNSRHGTLDVTPASALIDAVRTQIDHPATTDTPTAIESSPAPSAALAAPPTDLAPSVVLSQDVALMRSELDRATSQIVDLEKTVDELERKVETTENAYFEILGEADSVKHELALLKSGTAAESAMLPDLSNMPGSDGMRAMIQTMQSFMQNLHGAVGDFAALSRELESVKRDRVNLQSRIEVLEARTDSDNWPEQPVPPSDILPASVEKWVREQYEGKLLLHKRALQSLEDSPYEDAQAVYNALDLLANEYRDMRLRSSSETPETDEYTSFHERLESLGLRCSGSIAESELKRYHRHYHVPYNGAERFLELHLRNGGATADPRRCLRVYFFFDRDQELVVIGSLPGHLPNSMS